MQRDNCSLKTDSELLAEMANGNAYAFTTLYDKYKRSLYLLAFRRLGDKELVEDILQELFYKIWNGRANLSGIANFSGYIHQALKNQIIDHFLHQQHVRKYEQFFQKQTQYTEGTDQRVQHATFLERIFELISDRVPLGKEIFRMRMLEDRKPDEVALELGLSEKTVRNRLSLILKGLREQLPLWTIWLLFTAESERIIATLLTFFNGRS
ncbi:MULTISPECIES: RNA polymerase sigma factor [unclassified Sphingobacterium]|uniref:RNA polymerase sigma factor n=1 Tax=unclassified Sphingobacterium TaxID=2609468 RepID=UPI001048C8AA|nr:MULTISPECIES: sigma-70 family RNA polymerase sigma factor [unclassified Sphingobacterium]MCS3556136.1 RNA polymerase sigma-70 factor (ECF subfamily) [Sphingobacterium sp. JUb21]TCR08512.1 RNA polymerase sigma-70 factor (ECF subfamily) [Sphingobacterium sp. JUb20]